MHQERITSFLEFIDKDLSASEDIISLFDWFINDLKSAPELKKERPENLTKMKSFLEDNKRVITERFIKTGLNENNHTDYIYYGTPIEGTWGEVDKAIEIIISKSNSRPTLPMGSLTLQAWNRTNESKRHVIQAKWSAIEANLNEARNS